jgi:DNA-binding HxlR family transcriptional regulator
MAALDLLSRRWVLRILWELRGGPRGFREMQALCGHMSPNTLSTRLAELKEAGIVAHDVNGDWALTPIGRKLGPVLKTLDAWSGDWGREIGTRPTED